MLDSDQGAATAAEIESLEGTDWWFDSDHDGPTVISPRPTPEPLTPEAPPGPPGPGPAVPGWEQALRLAPGDRRALSEMEEAFVAAGEGRALLEVLELRIAGAEDDAGEETAVLAELLRRHARLATRLGEPRACIRESWERLLRLCGDDREALDRLIELHRMADEHDRLAAALKRRLLLGGPPAELEAVALEQAGLCEGKLGRPGEAVEALRWLLELDPRRQSALEQLHRLYLASEDWAGLTWVTQRLLDLDGAAPARGRLARDLGAYREQAGDREGALAAQELALRLDPDVTAPLRAIARVCLAGGQHERLLATVDRLLPGLPPGEPRRRLLAELVDAVGAASHPGLHLAALGRQYLETGQAGLLARIEQVAAAEGLGRELLELLELLEARAPLAERASFRLRRAALRERLADPSGALDELLAAFAIAPGNPRIKPEILRLAEATARWEEVLRIEAQLFEQADDPGVKAECACREAAILDERLGERGRAFRRYLQALPFTREVASVEAHLRRLAALLAPCERAFGELGQAYELLAETERPDRLALLGRAADFWLEGAGKTGRALAVLERALLLEPNSSGVRERLRALAQGPERAVQVGGVLLRVAERVSPADALELRREAAGIYERLGHPRDAESHYRAILQAFPQDRAALDGLERLLEAGGRWSELAEVLEARLAAGDRQLLRLADLYQIELRQPEAAIAALERYLAAPPASGGQGPGEISAGEVNRRLARLQVRSGRWSQAVARLALTAGASD